MRVCNGRGIELAYTDVCPDCEATIKQFMKTEEFQARLFHYRDMQKRKESIVSFIL